MSRPRPQSPAAPPRLRVEYVEAASPEALLAQSDVLAVFGFGHDAPQIDDPRWLRVPLQPHGAAPLEVWRAQAPVTHGREGEIAWACDGQLLFGAIEVDEPAGHTGAGDHSGILMAAEHAYRALTRFIEGSDYPHLLRIWNYLDAITLGDGDAERYRQFCVGRARGLGTFDTSNLPAATAIGRCDDARRIQVYWLAARVPGTPVENPRQVSAYRYPRQYGPQAPSFARAMLPPDGSAMPLRRRVPGRSTTRRSGLASGITLYSARASSRSSADVPVGPLRTSTPRSSAALARFQHSAASSASASKA